MAPTRVITGQATKIARTIHGIAYNPARDEIVVPNPLAGAVLVFRGAADGDEPPIRVIQGLKTKLAYPHAVAIDVQNKEILVSDPGISAVLAFPWDANGEVAPLRVIQGPKTKLKYVIGITVEPSRNLLLVASQAAFGESGLFIFNRTDEGDVPPKAMISGPRAGLRTAWQPQVYQDKIFICEQALYYEPPYILDKPREGIDPYKLPDPLSSDPAGFIGVWSITDSGDVPPRAIIKGALGGMIRPSGLGLIPQMGEITVSDSVRNGIFTFYVPEFFSDNY